MANSPSFVSDSSRAGFSQAFFVRENPDRPEAASRIGGEIVFFYHDSDHDPRETKTKLRHRKSGEAFEINFTFENKLQRKYSPLYLKRVQADWRTKTALQLPAYLDRQWVEAFQENPRRTASQTFAWTYTLAWDCWRVFAL